MRMFPKKKVTQFNFLNLPAGLSPCRCRWGCHASGLLGKAAPPFGFAAAALSSGLSNYIVFLSGLSGYICFFVFFFDLLWQLSYLNCQVTSSCVSLDLSLPQHFHNLMYRVRSYQSEFALESFVAPQVEPRWRCCNGRGREVHEGGIVGQNMETEAEQTFSQGWEKFGKNRDIRIRQKNLRCVMQVWRDSWGTLGSSPWLPSSPNWYSTRSLTLIFLYRKFQMFHMLG